MVAQPRAVRSVGVHRRAALAGEPLATFRISAGSAVVDVRMWTEVELANP